MTLSWSGENFSAPIRFAGTCRQYSNRAIDQLTRITFQRGTSRYFRCPYQANVIKMFDPMSNRMVHIRCLDASFWSLLDEGAVENEMADISPVCSCFSFCHPRRGFAVPAFPTYS